VKINNTQLATFPNIDYSFWFENYSWENFSSMNGMITTMKNKKFISEDINQNNITDNIKTRIESYIIDKSDEILFEIFKLIQTWGGKSSGKYTLKITNEWENIIENDFFKSNKEKYKEFVRLILEDKPIDSFNWMTNKREVFDKIEKKNLGINIKGLSYSFVPKHICFWSGKGERKEGLPILDDVIAKIVYKVDEAKKVDYETFINDIKQYALSKNLTPSQIEMALFTFAGNYWDTQKTATIEQKVNPKIKDKDLNEVREIIKSYQTNVKSKISKQKKSNKIPTINNHIYLRKGDFIKTKDGVIFIKRIVAVKIRFMDSKNSLKLNGDLFFKFNGDSDLIKIAE